MARSVVFSSLPDGLCVSGRLRVNRGAPSNLSPSRPLRDVPVFANKAHGRHNCRDPRHVRRRHRRDLLERDGVTWNPVDPTA